MQICLVSRDTSVWEVLAQVSNHAIEVIAPGSETPEADIYIWDFEPGIAAGISRDREKKHLFLVERDALPAFSEYANSVVACILLKPVTPPMLRAFLDSAQKQVLLAERAHVLESDRDALLQYALEANLCLQEYDQDRTNFLARALHDFRAPLTALHGYCGLLLEEQLGSVNAGQRDVLQRMQYSTRRLSRLSSGMFELSIQGHVARRLQLEPGDIEDLVAQAIHEMYPLVQEKEVSISVDIEAPGHTFLFEPGQVQQLLINILENACRFTPKSGGIEIQGYPVHSPDLNGTCKGISDDMKFNAYRVDVRDSGPGIPPDRLSAIFEQYTSYSGAKDRSGGGLGLAISKLIVASHGGTIWAESGGEGASFSFVLPFEPPVPMDQTANGPTAPHAVSAAF